MLVLDERENDGKFEVVLYSKERDRVITLTLPERHDIKSAQFISFTELIIECEDGMQFHAFV